MKEFWYVLGGAFLGFIICWLFFRDCSDGSPAFTCEKNKLVVQYCIDSVAIDYSSETNIDDKLNEYYSGAYTSGDSIGFSLDKTLVNNLAAYLSLDEMSFGVRIYPGHNGSNKFVLIKPLGSDGNERPDLGAIIDVTGLNMGLGGPCPKWCGNSGRLIISNNSTTDPNGG